MSDDSALVPGLILRRGSTGRCTYSPEAKRALVQLCSRPGVSVAGMALAHGINANLFGNVISLSGSYWWWPGFNARSSDSTLLNSESGWLAHEYAPAPNLPRGFYMNVGTWEGAVMLLPNRSMRDVLAARGYKVEYREFVGGHDPVAWRAGLAEGLVELLGRPAGREVRCTSSSEAGACR